MSEEKIEKLQGQLIDCLKVSVSKEEFKKVISELQQKVSNPEWLDVLILDLIKPVKDTLRELLKWLAEYEGLPKYFLEKLSGEKLVEKNKIGDGVVNPHSSESSNSKLEKERYEISNCTECGAKTWNAKQCSSECFEAYQWKEKAKKKESLSGEKEHPAVGSENKEQDEGERSSSNSKLQGSNAEKGVLAFDYVVKTERERLYGPGVFDYGRLKPSPDKKILSEWRTDCKDYYEKEGWGGFCNYTNKRWQCETCTDYMKKFGPLGDPGDLIWIQVKKEDLIEISGRLEVMRVHLKNMPQAHWTHSDHRIEKLEEFMKEKNLYFSEEEKDADNS